MAISELITKRATWYVDCHFNSILGSGHYGVVHKAKDGNGKAVAAKRIITENEKELSKLTTLANLEKLMDLNHPNIVTIFDIHQDDKAIWIIMELCKHGDLRSFMKKYKMTFDEKLQVMTQLAEGIQYLHENNIIHRDVKPLNILVDSVNPIRVKLTDFDLSKFLDEDYATSHMESNVGTMAFKAPEFFLRTKEGKLFYRRSVDVYALGLTCLAMIQHNDPEQSLCPKIETFTSSSDRHSPSAGQVIAGNIKEKKAELSVVCTASVSPQLAETFQSSPERVMEVKLILHNMTQAFEENRFSAVEVLKTLKSVWRYGTALTHNAASPDGSPAEAAGREQERRGGATNNQSGMNNNAMICFIRLHRTLALKTDMSSAYSVLPLNQHHILVYGERDWKICMYVFCRVDGALVKEIPSECNHLYCCGASSVCRHPVDCNLVLETCTKCKKIRSYNTDTGSVSVVYKKKEIDAVCRGPSDTVIAIEEGKYMYQLEWQSTKKQFAVVRIVDLKVMSLSSMCYIEDLDSVIIVSQNPCLVQSVKLDSGCLGNRLWTFNLEMCDEKEVNPNGLCFDTRGRLYIGDMLNNRLLVFNAQRGGLPQVIDLDEDTSQIIDMYCVTEERDQLTLLQAGRRVSVCRIQEL